MRVILNNQNDGPYSGWVPYKIESRKKSKKAKITFIDFITSLILILRPWNFVSTLVELLSTSKKKIDFIDRKSPC